MNQVRNWRSFSICAFSEMEKTKTKQNKTKQDKTRQDKTRQNKTKQNKTKQNKTKQNKNKSKQKTKKPYNITYRKNNSFVFTYKTKVMNVWLQVRFNHFYLFIYNIRFMHQCINVIQRKVHTQASPPPKKTTIIIRTVNIWKGNPFDIAQAIRIYVLV